MFLNTINKLIFLLEKYCVFVEVGTECLNIIWMSCIKNFYVALYFLIQPSEY